MTMYNKLNKHYMFADLAVDVSQNNDVTFVRITYNDPSNLDTVSVTGVAKRHPTDRHVPQIGRELATARALAVLQRKLERKAINQINHIDHNNENKIRSAEKVVNALVGLTTFKPSVPTGFHVNGASSNHAKKPGVVKTLLHLK